MTIARYYRTARTAHLERLAEFVAGDFFYQNTMYDFDLSRLPTGASARQVSFASILRMIWDGRYAVLELVEPYAPSALPQTLALGLMSRLSRVRRRPSTQLVAYAIENADLPTKYSRKFHVPSLLTRLAFKVAVSFGYRSLSRIAFGTADAEANYRKLLGRTMNADPRAPKKVLIEGLPSPRDTSTATGAAGGTAPSLVFLGALDRRKGIMAILGAWPRVSLAVPSATFEILGKGPLASEVTALAAQMRNVQVTLDPDRPRIWERLEASTVLSLLSQPSSDWKEQIGLPIVEGLSVGLEIVASTETGIAAWLLAHGHRVLPPDVTTNSLADALIDALMHARSRKDVQADLPIEDGRLAADRWLFEVA